MKKRMKKPPAELYEVEVSVLNWYHRLSEKNGAPPTWGEIGAAMRPKRSKQAVAQAVERLAAKGCMAPPTPWRITAKGYEWIR